jgi:hypothetical protein
MTPLIMHIRELEGHTSRGKHGEPVATIALDLDDEKHMRAGVSICSPHDQFVKRLGRAKAVGRLKAKNHIAHNNPRQLARKIWERMTYMQPFIVDETLIADLERFITKALERRNKK